jgi:hypothetical protein
MKAIKRKTCDAEVKARDWHEALAQAFVSGWHRLGELRRSTLT